MTINAENWIGENTGTIGTGSITLGGAIRGFARFNVAGDGQIYYVIQDGFLKETGLGTLTGNVLERTEVHATIDAQGNYSKQASPISLSGNAQVFGIVNAKFMQGLYNNQEDAMQAAVDAIAAQKAAEDARDEADQSEANALIYSGNALASKNAAFNSETAAKAAQAAASTSEAAAKASQTAAKTSETNAKTSETAAKTSQTAAKTSETNAKTSETNAAGSATAAATSETNAAQSKQSAANSATAAGASQTAAAGSATTAGTAATTATNKANEAGTSAAAALDSASKAKLSEVAAADSAAEAKEYADILAGSGAWLWKGEIPGGVNIDDYGPTSAYTGAWGQSSLSAAGAQIANGYPVSERGVLEVFNGGWNRGTQRYSTQSGRVFIRSLSAAWDPATKPWSNWSEAGKSYVNGLGIGAAVAAQSALDWQTFEFVPGAQYVCNPSDQTNVPSGITYVSTTAPTNINVIGGRTGATALILLVTQFTTSTAAKSYLVILSGAANSRSFVTKELYTPASVIPVTSGGTGANTAVGARIGLGFDTLGIGIANMTPIPALDWQQYDFTVGANFLVNSSNWTNALPGFPTIPSNTTCHFTTIGISGSNVQLEMTVSTVADQSFKMYSIRITGSKASRTAKSREIFTSASATIESNTTLDANPSNGTTVSGGKFLSKANIGGKINAFGGIWAEQQFGVANTTKSVIFARDDVAKKETYATLDINGGFSVGQLIAFGSSPSFAITNNPNNGAYYAGPISGAYNVFYPDGISTPGIYVRDKGATSYSHSLIASSDKNKNVWDGTGAPFFSRSTTESYGGLYSGAGFRTEAPPAAQGTSQFQSGIAIAGSTQSQGYNNAVAFGKLTDGQAHFGIPVIAMGITDLDSGGGSSNSAAWQFTYYDGTPGTIATPGGKVIPPVSDIRIKSNIQSFSPNDALDKIDQMKFYTYTKYGDFESRGVIAQELEQIDPMYVSKGTGVVGHDRDHLVSVEDFRSLDQQVLLMDALAAIQVLSKRVEQLETLLNKGANDEATVS